MHIRKLKQVIKNEEHKLFKKQAILDDIFRNGNLLSETILTERSDEVYVNGNIYHVLT